MNLKDATECDALSLALASLAWPSWDAGVWTAADSWTQTAEQRWKREIDAGMTSFYAVQRGRCQFESPVLEKPVVAQAGDLVLFPHGAAHAITLPSQQSDTPGSSPLGAPLPEPRQAETLQAGAPALGTKPSSVQPTNFPPVAASDAAANPTATNTTIVFGHFRPQTSGENPFHGSLSAFLQLNQSEFPTLSDASNLVRMVVDESARRSPGCDAIVNQLVQLLFHQALRAFTMKRDTSGAQAADLFQDPAIGLVVGLLHAQPEKAWTVATLAKWVRMSRSAFSERFREVVGKPPLQYLTELRMARACDLLTSSDLGVKQIAGMVGYESPSSFTNAFKRWKGVSPVTWRHREVA